MDFSKIYEKTRNFLKSKRGELVCDIESFTLFTYSFTYDPTTA